VAAGASSIELIYQGELGGLAALVRVLQDEGLDVWYDPPTRQRRGGTTHEVEVALIVSAVGPEAKVLTTNALEGLRSRWPTIKVRGKHENV
jgi:hypothetical protein